MYVPLDCRRFSSSITGSPDLRLHAQLARRVVCAVIGLRPWQNVCAFKTQYLRDAGSILTHSTYSLPQKAVASTGPRARPSDVVLTTTKRRTRSGSAHKKCCQNRQLRNLDCIYYKPRSQGKVAVWPNFS